MAQLSTWSGQASTMQPTRSAQQAKALSSHPDALT